MTFWEKIKFIGSQAWSFLLPFIKILLGQAGQILADTALQAVTTLSATDMSNEDKRAEAFKMITDELAKKGLQAATSTVNALIEAAVLKLKDQQTS